MAINTIGTSESTDGTPEEDVAQMRAFAEAVANWFIDHGITGHRLSPQGLGETNLAIETAYEVSEALNRRVEIEVIYVG